MSSLPSDSPSAPLPRWRRLLSLRMRLLAGTLVVMLAAVTAVGWGLRALFEHHITEQLHSQLELHLDQLSAAVQREVGAQGVSRIRVAALHSSPRWEQPFSGLYWQVEQRAPDTDVGELGYGVLERSRSLWDQTLHLPASAQGAQSSSTGVSYVQWDDPQSGPLVGAVRTLRLGGQVPALRLIVAAEKDLLAQPLAEFSSLLWASLLALALGLTLAVALQLHMALRPLKLLHQGLMAVRSGQTQQLSGQVPLELQPLVDDFNHVLRANTDMVERARTQAGNLAHAVHTPLTILANAAYSDRANPLAQLIETQVQVARQQVDYHLARARASAAVRATGLATPLHEPVMALARTMERLHADRQLQWQVSQIPENWVFRGEPQDLYEMLGNVLDNAGKWAQQRVSVQVLPPQGEQVQLLVDDDGPGIAPDDRARVLERGARLDEQSPGSGLGLDIVRVLVESYGGLIELQSSPLGGLRVVLKLPAAVRP